MSPGAVLPPELFDEVIDHLWDDKDALAACSLTCRAWLPSSRLHLFRTVHIGSAEKCTRFASLLDSSPDIARYVRKLTISADYKGVDANERPVEDDAWIDSASDLLSKLERIHTLALSRFRWGALSPKTQRAFSSLFRSVKSLFLFEITFRSSHDVLDFLSAFPKLEELYFHAVSWTDDSPNYNLLATTPQLQTEIDGEGRNLTYLFLDPRSSPTLVTEWILSHPSEQHLRTVQLCWRELDNTKPLADLLEASGTSLEHLRVEFPSGVHEEALLHNHLTLAHNTNLRSLHFGSLDAPPAESPTSPSVMASKLFPWVAHMLAQLHAPFLREIAFDLNVPDLCALRALEWARIDAELGRQAFRGLVVRFYVNVEDDEGMCGKSLREEVEKEIERRLPSFGRIGVLRVSCI